MTVQHNKKLIIAVWFSCGAASAVAAKLTLDKFGKDYDVRIFNTPIKEEDPDNIRFLKDVEKWLGVKIETASNPEYPDNSAVSVWEKRKYMSGIKDAPCTMLLKKEARYIKELEINIAYHVLGFTYDEADRVERFKKYERSNLWAVLVTEQITKNDCYKIIEDAGLRIPESYLLGLPNANCIGCPKATSPSYWNLIRKVRPKVFKDRAKLSRCLGARLVRYKGKRIFLDELPEDAVGRKIKGYDCGIFCETKLPRK